MNKRGPIIAILGIIIVVVSLSIAVSIVPSGITSPNDFSVPSLFEGLFDDVSSEILILSGDSAYLSYDLLSSDVSLLWGIQIIDFQSGDRLSIKISNIFGDVYGEFIQDEPILFEALEIHQSDSLNIEIQNIGIHDVRVIVMFSEDPENSDIFSNSDSPAMNMILPLAISGFLLILGIVISIVGVVIILVDWKINQNNKRNY